MAVHSMLSAALTCNPKVCRIPLQRAILVVSARRCAMTGIAEWLASIGLGEYADRFRENAIDLSVVRDLT